MCTKQRVKVQGKTLQKEDVNACKSHINRKLKACRNLFLSGKNSPSTHSSANGQILTRTLERKWLPNDRAKELLIRDWKLGTLNLAKTGTKISKRETVNFVSLFFDKYSDFSFGSTLNCFKPCSEANQLHALLV